MSRGTFSNRSLAEIVGRQPRDSMEDILRDAEIQDPPTIQPISSTRRIVLMVVLLIGFMFSILDTSIVSTALVSMAEDLQDQANAFWVVLSYLLTYMGFAIGLAKLSDIFGRGNVVLVSWVFFAMFSIGCALAKTMVQLIIFRAFQGIGGSGLYSLCQISLVELFPANPSLIGALVGCTLAISFVLGPILGGVISNFIGWPYIFWINVPFGALAIILVPLFWPRHKHHDIIQGLRRMDWVGTCFLLAGSILLVIGLQEGGSLLKSWGHPLVITSLVVATFAWLAFWAWETVIGLGMLNRLKLEVDAVFPVRLAVKRVYLAALLQTLFTGYPYIALTVVLPERFQFVEGDSPFRAGIRLLPLLAACALGSFLTAALSKKTNFTSLTLIFSSALQLIGLALLSTISSAPDLDAIVRQLGDQDSVNPDSNGNELLHAGPDGFPQYLEPLDVDNTPNIQYFFQFLFGLGVGMSLAAASMITSIQAENYDHASAHGAVAQARVFGGAIGVTTCSIVLNDRFKRYVLPLLPEILAEQFKHSPVGTLNKLTPEAREWVRIVYTNAFGTMIRGMLYVGIACIIASLFSWERNPINTIAAIKRHKMSIGTTGSGGSANDDSHSMENTAIPTPDSNHGQIIGGRISDTNKRTATIQRIGNNHTTESSQTQNHQGTLWRDASSERSHHVLDDVPTLATSIPGASIEMDDLSLRSSRYAPSRTKLPVMGPRSSSVLGLDLGNKNVVSSHGITVTVQDDPAMQTRMYDDDDDDDDHDYDESNDGVNSTRRFSLSATERI